MSRRVSRVRSSFSSWLMASGMARSHRGFAGTVQVLTSEVARAAGPGRVGEGDRRPTRRPRLVGCVRLDGGPAAAVPCRGGRTVSGERLHGLDAVGGRCPRRGEPERRRPPDLRTHGPRRGAAFRGRTAPEAPASRPPKRPGAFPAGADPGRLPGDPRRSGSTCCRLLSWDDSHKGELWDTARRRRNHPAQEDRARKRRHRAHYDRPWTLPRAPGAAVTATPGSGARARPEVLGVVVPGAAANHTTAGGRSGPRDRLPARREPPVPEDRAAQPPRVGVRRVRHPGANPLFHLSPRHPTTSRCSPTMRRGSRRGHLAAFLARRRLSLHPEKTHVASTSSPATFLGFELWPGAGVVGCRRRTCGVRGAEHLGDEVVEAVEVHVGEELARQVADRQPANGPSPLIPPADASGCRSRKACRCTT